MNKHEKQDDKDTYTRNGHKPGPVSPADSGGRHKKKDEDQDERDKEK